MTRLLAALLLAATAALVAPAAPASAAARVTVANPDGDAVVDPTYATTLTVRGTGFQAVRGGHGGIYVFFGAVKGTWQPSRGGATGQDYWYVPDSEARDNQGFQKYVAFPGSDTAGSANGGAMSAGGAWSTSVVVPGATFRAYDRSDSVRTIDCRTMTCGVITIGAHGIKSARNETFTPVRVASLQQQEPAAGSSSAPDAQQGSSAPGAAPEAGTAPDPGGVPTADAAGTDEGGQSGKGGDAGTGRGAAVGAPTLEVDRASAVAGNVLAFTATGLPPGRQVTVVLDDGAAGAGPFLVGADGTTAGVLTLPEDAAAGTHELRVHGVEEPPSVSFAIAAAEAEPAAATSEEGRAGLAFAGVAGVVLLAAVGRAAYPLLRTRRVRRAA
ncbi:hypothetical protein [Nocardioides marmotae]|uniref:hypothetical protein n=1 Tax=Nocardioides marmotae TaxID=2663857 RepID=UPI0012B52B14|nr:hypothetical protein [Nocardioides marmotae]MBC9733628.1 hypothetical protein [Nocardioides marmotae]MTB84731.1 hypothetical protein [Nocardioides marmotae]